MAGPSHLCSCFFVALACSENRPLALAIVKGAAVQQRRAPDAVDRRTWRVRRSRELRELQVRLDVNLNNLVVATISIQFVFFGWRVLREIAVGDKGPKEGGPWRTWLPWPDRVNLVSLCLVTIWCIVAPIISGHFTAASRAVLVNAVVLWMCHPFSVACHYELFRGGRYVVYGGGPEKWPLVTNSERKMVIASVLLSVGAGLLTWGKLAL